MSERELDSYDLLEDIGALCAMSRTGEGDDIDDLKYKLERIHTMTVEILKFSGWNEFLDEDEVKEGDRDKIETINEDFLADQADQDFLQGDDSRDQARDETDRR